MPIPLLAAALGADTQSVLLAYGNHLQPVMEQVVGTHTLWGSNHKFHHDMQHRSSGKHDEFCHNLGLI